MAAVISILSVAALAAVDQVIKFFAERDLAPIGEKVVVPGFLGWEYVRNTGAAFGSFSNNTVVLSVITGIIIVIGLAAIIMKKISNKFLLTVTVMIISGGIGNLIDRITKGYVTDYIKVLFVDFPVFNFADILVTCGSFMLIIYLIRDIYNDRKKKKNGE
ncbi:MAG: signal peptidase II [Clostridia bacterium]|nr:signal peptidase II [Clostridia bacterium]